MPSEMIPPCDPSRGPAGLRELIARVLQELEPCISHSGNEHLVRQWPEWSQRLHELSAQLEANPTVSVSLVGDSGAGKSTLINALVGARLLPVSDRKACTSAVTEIVYAAGPYAAEITFISPHEWQREVDALRADIREASVECADEAALTGEERKISQAALDKLWSVYRSPDQTDKSTFDPRELELPADIQAALSEGRRVIEHQELLAFSEDVKQYLTSAHRYWPIVQRVHIRGPFDVLADGITLVDLPGVNDPNEAREAVTKEHLRSCRFVWVVFNMVRNLSRSAISLMESDDFLRQIIMDDRADSLTFVGTHAEDVDEPDDDRPMLEVIQTRNKEVQSDLRDQLADLAARIASRSQEYEGTAERIGNQLKSSPMFAVSAREFLRLAKISDKRRTPILEHPEETGIPALADHLQATCRRFGTTERCDQIQRQIKLLLAEITAQVHSQQEILHSQIQVSVQIQKEVRAEIGAARQVLDWNLQAEQLRLADALGANQTLLGERVARAVDKARQKLAGTMTNWDQLHWATLKAVCQREGVFHAQGEQRSYDFPADVSRPILESIELAWSDFFADKLRLLLERWVDRHSFHAVEFRGRLLEIVQQRHAVTPDVLASLKTVFETNQKVLKESLAQIYRQMESRIQSDQRTLYQTVNRQVHANLRPAFVQARDQSGSGMKARIMEILRTRVDDVAEVMFDEAREKLLAGVSSLNDWIRREAAQMSEAVGRAATSASENLLQTINPIAVESIERAVHDLNGVKDVTSRFENATTLSA